MVTEEKELVNLGNITQGKQERLREWNGPFVKRLTFIFALSCLYHLTFIHFFSHLQQPPLSY